MKSHELLPLLPFVAPGTLSRAKLTDLISKDDLAGPSTFLLRGVELDALKAAIQQGDPLLSQGLAKLRDLASEAQLMPILTVTSKTALQAGATAHDYVSHAIYFWPNPNTADGLPYVRRDGEVNPETYDEDRFDVQRLERLSGALFVLSLAYFLSGEASYGQRAASLLRAWFVAPKTRQTPHFDFAQSITGKTKGRPEGLIEARRLIYVLDAEALLSECPSWTKRDKAEFRRWFTDFYGWFRTSAIGRAAAGKKNNIGIWYDTQAAIYALFLGERELAESIVRASVTERLPQQIGVDGAPLQELDRARPYDYAAFNLLAMMGLARAGEATGFDAWWAETKDGRSFQRALKWMLQVAGPQSDPQAVDISIRAARAEEKRSQAEASLEDAKAAVRTHVVALEHARSRATAAEARIDELTVLGRRASDQIAEFERREGKSAEAVRRAEREALRLATEADEEKERAERLLRALEAARVELEVRSSVADTANVRAADAARALQEYEASASRLALESEQRLVQALARVEAAEAHAANLTIEIEARQREAAQSEAELADYKEALVAAQANADDLNTTLSLLAKDIEDRTGAHEALLEQVRVAEAREATRLEQMRAAEARAAEAKASLDQSDAALGEALSRVSSMSAQLEQLDAAWTSRLVEAMREVEAAELNAASWHDQADAERARAEALDADLEQARITEAENRRRHKAAEAEAELAIRRLKEETARRTESERKLIAQRAALKETLGRLKERVALANDSIRSIHGSTSWRVTAPLRGASRLLRGERSVPMSVAFAGQTPSIELMEEGHGAMSSLALQAPNAIAVQPSSKALNGHAAQEVVNAAVVQMRTTPVGVAKTPPPTVREAASLDGGCLPHYVASLRTAVDALEKSALRHRSLPARDFLARVATGGAYGYDQLEAALEADGSVTSRLRALGPGMLHRRALGALARVVGNQEVTPTDPQRAIALYEAFGDIFEYEKLRPIDHILYVDLLTREGRADEARVALERSDLQRQDAVEYACLLANLIHPGPTPKTGDAQAWLNALNGMHSPSGIEDVFLTDDSGPLIGRFGCNIRGGPINDGPLVSVLMTTFNPDATLDMAVKSVLAQSWRNLELIIVDDCSTDEAFATIKGWEAHDPRVQVVRMEANGGTYVAKNRGLSMARGEFVTCHDSDDWSHPRKLQRQAEQLLANAGEIGNMTSWIRATPSMEIRRFSATGKMLYPNTSSLMFRREPVVRRCGSWDDVRTGADSELYRRIELTFAQTIPVHGDPPLSFGQIRAGALTHETLGNGWESPARKAYRSAWRHWHAHEKDQGVRMESGSPRRKFYAPAALLPSRSAGEARQLEFDVIIGSDFRMAGGNTTSCIEEIKANTRAGLRTAICQMNSFRRGLVGKDFLDSRIMELLRDGQVDQVELEDDVRCRLLLLRYPPILQFVTGLRSGIRAQNVRVIVNQPPAEKDGSDRRYDVGACARHALALFGKPAIWAPIGLLARESVQANLSRAQLARDDWHNVIDVDEWSVARTDFVGDRPVIGRHSRDDVTKWPEDPGIVRAVYPTDGSVQVRVLGGAASVQKVLGLGSAPANWEVFPFDAVAPKEFLSSIDYFVYFHHSQRVEAFGRTIIEAMAAGCVAILPRHFEPIFGDGALYCEPRDVQSLVKALYADKARHFEISLRGVNFVRDHFGYGVHERRVRDIIGEN